MVSKLKVVSNNTARYEKNTILIKNTDDTDVTTIEVERDKR